MPSTLSMYHRSWPGEGYPYGPTAPRCNLSCGYCNDFDEVSAPVPKQLLKQRIDKLADFGTWLLELTGGETLLHPDLIELVAYGARYRFYERWIITNGYLLSPDLVMQLNDAGLTHLQVSIDGVTPNNTTVKVLKPLRKKIEHLRKHAKFTVQINAVLGAGNDEEVLDVMTLICASSSIPGRTALPSARSAACARRAGSTSGADSASSSCCRRWRPTCSPMRSFVASVHAADRGGTMARMGVRDIPACPVSARSSAR